jgi:hypothetical protein
MRLTGVQPELALGEAKLSELATAHGLAYTVNREELGGFVRTRADTAAYMGYRDLEWRLYAARQKVAGKPVVPKEQWRPIAEFGSSYHNYGAAFDVTMVKGTHAQLGALAPAAGLRWGGDAGFQAARRTDPPHFQLPITLLEAKARWLKLGNAPGSVSAKVQAGAVATLLLLGLFLTRYGSWTR